MWRQLIRSRLSSTRRGRENNVPGTPSSTASYLWWERSSAGTGCPKPTATTSARPCGSASSSTSGAAEPDALPGWIRTTTRNECLRVLAARGRVQVVDPQEGGSFPDAGDAVGALDDELLAAERRQALREALTELPAGRRDLLQLLLTDPPLAYEEISARLGIPIGSIGPTRARALEQLRRSRALRDLRDMGPYLVGGVV